MSSSALRNVNSADSFHSDSKKALFRPWNHSAQTSSDVIHTMYSKSSQHANARPVSPMLNKWEYPESAREFSAQTRLPCSSVRPMYQYNSSLLQLQFTYLQMLQAYTVSAKTFTQSKATQPATVCKDEDLKCGEAQKNVSNHLKPYEQVRHELRLDLSQINSFESSPDTLSTGTLSDSPSELKERDFVPRTYTSEMEKVCSETSHFPPTSRLPLSPFRERSEQFPLPSPSDGEPLDIIPKSLYYNKHQSGHLCIFCGKTYSRKYGLKIHLRTHTGYKPLKCKVCERPFGDPSNLNKHVRLHAEGETPYRCVYCGKILVRRRDLERHVKSRHPEYPVRPELCTDGIDANSRSGDGIDEESSTGSCDLSVEEAAEVDVVD